MALARSLGLSSPSALSYLVAEGFLPPEPTPAEYTWVRDGDRSQSSSIASDELLSTRTCVVWSRFGIVQRVFNFEIEKEDIIQTIFATFPKDDESKEDRGALQKKEEERPAYAYADRLLNVRKRPTSKGSGKQQTDSEKLATEVEEAKPHETNRAIVVLLKTQIHIFFIGGNSHVVHLPFEPSGAFSTPFGLLIQRDASGPTPSSFKAPKTPANSFMLPLSSSFTPASIIPKQANTGEESEFLTSLYKAHLSPPMTSKQDKTPSHVCLRDPLVELGIVGEVTESEVSNKSPSQYSHFAQLPRSERLIYVSPAHEANTSSPLLLALTWNTSLARYTFWKIVETPSRISHSRKQKPRHSVPSSNSRRRSSHGPGTGATTPALRNSINPARESFGGLKEIQATFPRTDTELASQLDPAFEDPSAPAQSSRRISSLLARSDLGTNTDTATLADAVSGHPTGRRGPSFGAIGTRASFGAAGGSLIHSRKSARVSQLDFVKNELDDIPSGDVSDESNSLSEEDSSPPPRKAMRSLQHDVALVKLDSFQPPRPKDQTSFSIMKESEQPLAFTIESPPNDFQQSRAILLCIFHSGIRRLFTVYFKVVGDQTSFLSASSRLKVEKTETVNDVIDICRISVCGSSKIVVLRKSSDGNGVLTLQTPWNLQMTVQLPSKLLIRNPFESGGKAPQARRREGGLKRVLSEGIDKMCGLRSCPMSNQFDVKDSKGVWHRLEIDLNPTSSFVSKVLRACQLVLPVNAHECQPILRCWVEVKSWLRQAYPDIQNSEWTAFVVMLFSMFCIFLPGKLKPNAARSRRKAGLLRTASGASIDTEEFDAMMLQEDRLGTKTPPWLRSRAWQWSLNDSIVQGLGKNSTASFLKKISFLPDSLGHAREFIRTEAGQMAFGNDGYLLMSKPSEVPQGHQALSFLLVVLHLLREESKLDLLASEETHSLSPILAQMGGWLGCEQWSWKEGCFYSLENTSFERWTFDESCIDIFQAPRPQIAPPSILRHIEASYSGAASSAFPTLLNLETAQYTLSRKKVAEQLTPRSTKLLELLELKQSTPAEFVDHLASLKWSLDYLETFPEAVVAPLRSALALCQAKPPTKMSSNGLAMIDRNDLAMLEHREQLTRPRLRAVESPSHEAIRDFHTIANTFLADLDLVGAYDGAAELDRQTITRLVFKDDQRFSEASRLVHPLKPAVARCIQEPDWTDTDLLEAQQEMVKVIAIRTLSVSPGRGMLFYSARYPLLTEKFPIHGFTLSCIMKPMNTTVTADRNTYTEEKVSWAFFHAGVEAGLTISKGAKGIDTSWILFNKPRELGDRHAGFLLALGLNGHLKSIAKWVAFKYLTPKHTMTSIGLLLGLSASYLGSMDTLITRLLSVHVTRMLPAGAAELNLSPLTQTTGIMGLGLLYCNTQHRRMSEVMLSEMENIEQDENANPMETLRDEGYRLAAGFALGYINLGQGRKLKGLNDMRIVERLLALAVATKKVDLVHILDKATAAATVALALIFLKTEDLALAKKIDVPDTVHQFEYVRPDIFLLRTIARHLIMWNGITPNVAWIQKQLPAPFQSRVKLNSIRALHTEDLPLYNIVTGLCVVIGLRFAGTARQDVRDLLGSYLDQLIRINRLPALHYDGKLTRITTRNCQDAVALAAASVMAGTGDVYLLRRFRALHGRTDPDTPFGSHMAAHQAIGVLFLGGGTHTFNTSNIAIASLLCAFYPLFPANVQDNKAHLQAFRHLWVFAAEPRCLIVRSAETYKAISLPIVIVLRSGEELDSNAPCLLPPLERIAKIYSNDPQYWRVTLDFAGNPSHLAAFKRHQSMFVRRRGPYDAQTTVFAATMQALNDRQMSQQMGRQAFEWIFSLPSLASLDRAERALVLPNETVVMLHMGGKTTAVDDRLTLERECIMSTTAERLWNLRVLFAWAEHTQKQGGELAWLGKEVVEALRAKIALMWGSES